MDTYDAPAFDALAAQVSELAQRCARLSDENVELRHQVSALLAGQAPDTGAVSAAQAPAAQAPAAQVHAAQARPSHRESGRHVRADSTRPPEGAVSRRTIGKVIGAAAAAGVVGTAAFVDLHSRAASAADVADEQPTAYEAAEAAGSASVISATLSTSAAVVVGANSSSGAGVEGTSKTGRGGVFSGSAAQVHLNPGTSSTHPKTGQAGDLYVDKTGRLWFCSKSGSKDWKQIG